MIGELEKRINKMLFLSHAGKDLDDDYEQKRVHQIIEDVKKEFPDIVGDAGDMRNCSQCEEKIKWFKKQFGEK